MKKFFLIIIITVIITGIAWLLYVEYSQKDVFSPELKEYMNSKTYRIITDENVNEYYRAKIIYQIATQKPVEKLSDEDKVLLENHYKQLPVEKLTAEDKLLFSDYLEQKFKSANVVMCGGVYPLRVQALNLMLAKVYNDRKEYIEKKKNIVSKIIPVCTNAIEEIRITEKKLPYNLCHELNFLYENIFGDGYPIKSYEIKTQMLNLASKECEQYIENWIEGYFESLSNREKQEWLDKHAGGLSIEEWRKWYNQPIYEIWKKLVREAQVLNK